MRSPSCSAAGARLRKWSARGLAPWGTPNGCRRCGSTLAWTTTATARFRRLAHPTTRSDRPRYFVERGKYRRGEPWGYEVRVPHGARGGSHTYAEWQKLGVHRADGEPYPQPNVTSRLWT